jgi:hypothetical protein
MKALSQLARFTLFASIAMLAVSGGCAKHHQDTKKFLPPLTGTSPGYPGTRDQMWIDFDGFQLDPGPALNDPATFHQVGPQEVQCLAADSATVGNLMTMEAKLACCSDGRSAQAKKLAGIIQRLYLYRAAYDRNEMAAKALEAYYRLVEAEYGRDRLTDALVQIDVMLQFADEIEASQLDVPSNKTELERQRSDLVQKRAEVEQSIAELNSNLRFLTGTHPSDDRRFWPMVEFSSDEVNVDVPGSIARATVMRPDLAALQLVWNCFDDDNLPAVRRAVGQADPLLGSISCEKGGKLFGWLRKDSGNDMELETRREQLQTLMFDTQRLAAEEVRRAAADVAAGYEQLKITLDQLNRWRAEIIRQQELTQIDEATEFDIRKAQLEWISAQSAVMKQLVAVEIGWVKLRQAQGLLVYECGYTDAKSSLAKTFGHQVVLHEIPTTMLESLPQPPELPAEDKMGDVPSELKETPTPPALPPNDPTPAGTPNSDPRTNLLEPQLKSGDTPMLQLPPPEVPSPLFSGSENFPGPRAELGREIAVERIPERTLPQ